MKKACLCCGCTEARACVGRREGPCAWMEFPYQDFCTYCAEIKNHQVRMHNDKTHSIATCSCGNFESRTPWGKHHQKQDAAVRAHWIEEVRKAQTA